MILVWVFFFFLKFSFVLVVFENVAIRKKYYLGTYFYFHLNVDI